MRTLAASLGMLLVVGGAVGAPAAAQAQPLAEATCVVPVQGTDFPRVDPSAVAVNPQAVHDAIAYATSRNRFSIQIFRHNCLIGEGPYNRQTVGIPSPLFSATKSIVSLAAGVAYDRGKLDLDEPIGTYLPEGWGDDAHRAITVRQLLTQTSGQVAAIGAESVTAFTDPNIALQALALPIVDEPGTVFRYSQRNVDLLAYVIGRAVGEDLQAFTQRELFDLIGIPVDSYRWLRDRSGNTYGYAHMMMPPEQFAKLGLLMTNGGTWNGTRVLSREYTAMLHTPSATNGCYGLLFWVNAGDTCLGTNTPPDQPAAHRMIMSAPTDLYSMNGAMAQNNFMIPSLDITVTWTGVQLPGVSGSSARSDLYHEFFRALLGGVQDVDLPDPGPYVPDPAIADTPANLFDPEVLRSGMAPTEQCTIIRCPPQPGYR